MHDQPWAGAGIGVPNIENSRTAFQLLQRTGISSMRTCRCGRALREVEFVSNPIKRTATL
jgi:hypothetical protein